ncbi:MAG TPA: response regulator [Ruminococcus sp.]
MKDIVVKDTILVVDDDSSNLMLANKILCKEYHVASANSGAAALKYLEKNIPALILMDIIMPEMNGFETVEIIKKDERCKAVPIIFLTAEKNPETEKKCFSAGAQDFVTKPFVPDLLLSRVERILELERYRKNLEVVVESQTRQLAERAKRISNMQESVIVGMANLIELRDGSTGEHVKNTRTYVKMIVEKLLQKKIYTDCLNSEYADNIIKAAPLHDIGKIRIPDSILLKPGKLTDDEFTSMKMHTEYGVDIIRDIISDVEDESYTKTAAEIALCHHERWDGRGYPYGMSGRSIPLSARIMAVADVFDALYAERCYKKPIRPVEKAMDILLQGRGTQFDAEILDVFVGLRRQVKEFLGEECSDGQ